MSDGEDLKKGRDVLHDQLTTMPGTSDVGIEIRRADPKQQGTVAHGYARVADAPFHNKRAKDHLHGLIHAIKKQPKPNLPKSEDVNKSTGHIKGVHTPTKTHPQGGESKAGVYNQLAAISAASGLKPIIQEAARSEHEKVLNQQRHMPKPNLPKSEDEKGVHMPMRPGSGVSDMGLHARSGHKDTAKDRAVSTLKELHRMKKPKLTKSDIESFDDQLKKDDTWSKKIAMLRDHKEQMRQQDLYNHFKAKGMRVPSHLKEPQQGETLNYGKIKNQFNSQNKAPAPASMNPVTPMNTNKKLAASEKVKIQPDQVSDPIMQNRATLSAPSVISGPTILSPTRDANLKKCSDVLRRMIGGLKKVDPVTRLPGILINKNDKAK